ncbi:hypothetical protein GGR54DRAFT_633934 [Hypoxylon sp. NC1633]|nr:hypothetical protein GGR54DRAFT_633934 [Hypoxylon sp. NC1633]
MSENRSSSDFHSKVNVAAAGWYSQHSNEPSQPGSNHADDEHAEPPTNSPTIRDSTLALTAWQSSLLALPDEFKDLPAPIHTLSQALANQKTLRPIEWNTNRQLGGFKPRLAADFSSMMIYVSGQVNPNPCRNCRLMNGPYAHCVVAPPSVLALSTLKHACANCTYQNQQRKCTNLPISDEEMVTKTRKARSSFRLKNQITMKTTGRRPKSVATNNSNTQRKPTAHSISADGFADKLRLVRSWSPLSRCRMKAQVTQWQAAIATVEAETAQGQMETGHLPATVAPPSRTPSHVPATPSIFAVPRSTEGSLAEAYDEEAMEVEENHDVMGDYEGPSWPAL